MTTPTNSRSPRWPAIGALAALVFASRAWLAQAWGSAVPFWDQWDAEALNLYRPWLDGSLRLANLFAPHNEHRIVLTRLADLGFFIACNRWEPWAQLLLNAVLHAATAAALAAVFWPALSTTARRSFMIIVAVLFTAPSGWQNALWGFQSQVYFSNALAVAALWGLTLMPPWSRSWWAGWSAALLALFSFGGGVFAALAAAITITAASFFPPREHREKITFSALALIAAIVAMGVCLLAAPVQHDALRARSPAEFFGVFARCLSWPHVDSPWAWFALQAPLAVLLALRWRRGLDRFERGALGLVMFAVLQSAAVALNRGGGLIDARPLSRYQDPLLPGLAAQAFAVLRLATEHARIGRLAALGWAALVAIGLIALTTTNLSLNLPYKRAQDRANLAQVRAYLATHDATIFTRDPLFPGPHLNRENLRRVLDDPILRPSLPRIFFTPEPESAPGMKPWIIERGFALTLVALLAFLAALAWPARRTKS